MLSYVHSIAGLIIGILIIYGFYLIAKKHDTETRKKYGWIIFGPFWPLLNKSIEKHDGLTRREIIGWVIVFIMMMSVLFLEKILVRLIGN